MWVKMHKFKIIKTDVAIIGAGGSGLRAAIEIAENNP
ncbi:MAG: fumarate reductase flavoprotein subunit, partial [Moritella dasanensis]